MNTKQILALIGCGILFLGTFAPLVSVPIVGSINYFQNGKGDGIFIILFAALAAIGALTKRNKLLWISGVCSIALLTFTFISFQSRIADAKANMDQQLAGNPFRGLGGAMLNSMQIQWGFGLLVIGAILVIVAATIKVEPPPRAPRAPELPNQFAPRG